MKYKYCKECHTVLSDGGTYCKRCGKPTRITRVNRQEVCFQKGLFIALSIFGIILGIYKLFNASIGTIIFTICPLGLIITGLVSACGVEKGEDNAKPFKFYYASGIFSTLGTLFDADSTSRDKVTSILSAIIKIIILIVIIKEVYKVYKILYIIAFVISMIGEVILFASFIQASNLLADYGYGGYAWILWVAYILAFMIIIIEACFVFKTFSPKETRQVFVYYISSDTRLYETNIYGEPNHGVVSFDEYDN